MKLWRGLLWALVLLVGLAELYWLYLLLIDGVDAFPTTEDRRAGIWVGLGGAAVLWGLWRGLRRVRDAAPVGTSGADPRLERRILGLAQRSGGRLSVAEVALGAKVSVEQADAALRDLVRQGVATVYHTPDMDPVYVIAGFDEAAQAKAQDLLGGRGP